MNSYFVAASALLFLVGLIHSVLGEILIFRRMRRGSVIPAHGGELLRERHARILWAAWHVVTVMGWGIAAILLWIAFPAAERPVLSFVAGIAIASTLAGSLLVLVGTEGKHPAWIGLLGVATLVSMGLGA
jgi:hypothetical protein